jgi:hypothetical protein
MAQIKKSFDEVRIPFTKMSFTPDVPSTQLGPNEYNDGLNVETDVRGIRSMAGDETIFRLPVPGTPTYISGGFRQDDRFWTIVATDEGYWWASSGGVWFDITPPGGVGTYTQNQNITEGWNGTVPFFNDEQNPPMFWPEDKGPRFATTSASSSAGTTTIGFLTQTDTLSGVSITGIAGQFAYTSGENIRAGMKMRVSGTITTTPTVLSTVTITGTSGQFACAATTLAIGQRVDISGTFGGTGSITGYVNPSTYYIVATNGATTFQLSTVPGGTPVVTTAGTPTGLTYTVVAPAIIGYSNPTTYYVKTANGTSTFTLSATLGGPAITTVPGIVTGLTFLYTPFAIGETIAINGVAPTGFNGTYTVTNVSNSSVSFAGSTAGPQTRAGTVGVEYPQMIMYSNTVPQGIATIEYVNETTQRITLDTSLTVKPYKPGEYITISDVNQFFNGTFEVVDSTPGTPTTIDYLAQPGAVYPGFSVGSVAAEYSWNYNPNWTSYYAKFMRLYNTPNVGCILVAGDLTAINATTGETEFYPVTVQWSQSFGLNQAPRTWTPTVINIANQLEVPLRGEALDAFPNNGNLFICSYWDTVVFSPINFTTTSAPILGVRLFNQGRGLLSSNCWANTDKMVYGIDARDIWVFNGQDFQGLGNQRVKNWFYDQLDPQYVDRVFMQVNSQRNQIEIYYPTLPPVITNVTCVNTTGGFVCNGSDLKVNQQVRVTGTLTGTGTISGYSSPKVYYIVEVTGATGGTFFRLSATEGGTPLTTTPGTMTGLTFTVRLGDKQGVPNKMLSYRYDLDVWNAPRDVASATSAAETPVRNERTDGTWAFNKGSRTVMYARGVADSFIVQKDQGYSFINDAPIESRFRRDNIKLLPDYSGKLLVHRILPEIVNMNDAELPINPQLEPELIGSVSFKVDGANSVGQEPVDTTSQGLQTNTDNPWVQIDQNAHRVNALEIGNTSNQNIWMCSATTWQYTQTEDDR